MCNYRLLSQILLGLLRRIQYMDHIIFLKSKNFSIMKTSASKLSAIGYVCVNMHIL